MARPARHSASTQLPQSDSSFDLLVSVSCSLELLLRCSCCSTHANSLALLHSACTKRMQHIAIFLDIAKV